MYESFTFQPTIVRTSSGLTIAGTRITLYQIMDYLKAGKPPETIRDDFRLTVKQTADVLNHIETHRTDVEKEYTQVIREAEKERRYWEEFNRERMARIERQPSKPGQRKIREKLRTARQNLGNL